MWEGGEAWIIGGGPSIPRQFGVPETVITSVLNGDEPLSVFSPYFSPIHNKHVIGVNMAYKLGSWVDMMFFGDLGFFLKNRFALAEYSGVKISCHHAVNGYEYTSDKIKYLPKHRDKVGGISDRPDRVCWNGNSGAAAVSVAVQAGAKRIILLGFDMKRDEAKTHWHREYYPPETKKGAPSPLTAPYHRWATGFENIARDAQKMGIEILNANPDSAIPHFKKVTVKELL